MTSTATQIKANELRIGNYLQYNDDSMVKVEVQSIEYSGTINNGLALDRFEPISLTPELLERCGFESTTQSFNDGKTMLVRQEKHIDEYTTITAYVDNDSMGIVLEQRPQTKVYAVSNIQRITVKNQGSLHQLQNLYLALTGTELEIDFTDKIFIQGTEPSDKILKAE